MGLILDSSVVIAAERRGDIESAAKGTKQIDASQVEGWLRHPSVEVLGAVAQHIVRQS